METLPQEGFQFSIAQASLKFESDGRKDTLRAIVEKIAGREPENIQYKYEWSINRKPAGDNSDSIGGFKRGDFITVKITPYDGDMPGSYKVLSVTAENSSPKPLDMKALKSEGTNLSYQVVAADPDGDAISYELIDAPSGMTINSEGVINWQVKDDDYGTKTVKVKISDNKGGDTTWPVDFTVKKKTNEAAKNK
jgi:hypothetical protein